MANIARGGGSGGGYGDGGGGGGGRGGRDGGDISGKSETETFPRVSNLLASTVIFRQEPHVSTLTFSTGETRHPPSYCRRSANFMLRRKSTHQEYPKLGGR